MTSVYLLVATTRLDQQKSNTCQIATVNQAKEAMHRKTKDRKY